MGYEVNPVDDRFYYKIDLAKQELILVPVHVDDNYATYTRDSYLIAELREGYKLFFGEDPSEDDGQGFIGLHIEHNRELGEVFIDMRGYTEAIFEKYGEQLQNLHHYKYPGPITLFKDRSADAQVLVDLFTWKSILMSFMFLGRLTRPEIQVVCSVLARIQVPNLDDTSVLMHMAGYVHGTMDHKVRIAPRDTQIGASVDAAYNVYPDGSSQSGFILTMGQSPMGFYSNRIKEIATSSTHAELLALYRSLTLICWARHFLDLMGFHQEGPSVVSQDNRANVFMADSQVHCSFKNSRHLLVKYSWLRQLHQQGVFKCESTSTLVIASDLLSKIVADPECFPDKLMRATGYWPCV
jgi:hypothetical protein